MSETIPGYPELLVISDTGMFRRNEDIYAFGPVVKELEALDSFGTIRWIGFNRPDQINNNSYIKIQENKIYTKSLKKTGGPRWIDKFLIFFQYPIYIITIFREIYRAEYIHVRAPSHPAVIAILISFYFSKKQFWFKYAGDWIGKTAPFYEQQRKWLKILNQNCVVTINGNWNNQPQNVISFENPCLDAADRVKGREFINRKNLGTSINYCFVGDLNENKGGLTLLQGLKNINLTRKSSTLHIVGDGLLKQQLEKIALELEIPVEFHGAISKDEVTKIYELCHYIILPSKSEGFPKVIGEAMNFGCIPIVSNISCIGQYIHHNRNGILIENIDPEGISIAMNQSFEINQLQFESMVHLNYKLASNFTYEYYNSRIKDEIFKLKAQL